VVSVTLAAERVEATRGSLTSADGTKLVYRAWPRANAGITFAVVHGLGEHSGRYQRFADGMARHGMATYAVDLRGHGESAGPRGHIDSWSQWVDDVVSFVELVEREAKGEVVPLGHSFGGAVMLSAIESGRLANAKRFVLSSPAIKIKAKVPAWKSALGGLTARVAPRLAMSNQVDPATVSRIPEVVEAYRTDPLVHDKISSGLYAAWQRAVSESLEHAGEIKIPFLILAGTADMLIDPEGSRELHARAPVASELRLLEGRYHEPFNDLGSDEVFSAIADWLNR
jgi:alpha-beta hydrolase superfamily lysophospholipase